MSSLKNSMKQTSIVNDAIICKRAIDLAKQGEGFTNPNPLVGAVIVKDEKIIGEGYHEQFGGPHAEVNAFLNATSDVTGATMYVTLEPCSHYGKTPPCALKIIEKGIKKVVISQLDPNPLVYKKGVKLLEDAGIEVTYGILEEQAKKTKRYILKIYTNQKTFCRLKICHDIRWQDCDQDKGFEMDYERKIKTFRSRTEKQVYGHYGWR